MFLVFLAPVLGFITQFKIQSAQSLNKLKLSSYQYAGIPQYPPPPAFVPKPLPVLLGGGLFLFARSVRGKDKAFADELLKQAQVALRQDATIGMELGQGVETGGVYSSMFAQSGGYDQLVLQFQIEGGNAWAQGVAYGVRQHETIQLVSLEVANMDASINGTPFEINIPLPKGQVEEENGDESKQD